jgi:hypothetical protein
MNSIKILKNNTVHYGAQHYASDYFLNPGEQIAKDLNDSQMSADIFSGNKVIVDFRFEGQDPDLAEPLLTKLDQMGAKEIFVIYNACVDIDQLNYQALCVKEWGLHFFDIEAMCIRSRDVAEIDRKFLCLLRRPSLSRAKLAQALVNNVESLRISFGSGSDFRSDFYQSFFPNHQYPILIDGHVSFERHNEHADLAFYTCLFNIVAETSSQTDEFSWRSKFLTEKTFKAFALRQIPIWFAVPGLVGQVRQLGFDLFDDIVDHSYDQIQDPDQRRQQVIETVVDLDQRYSFDDCAALKQQLQNRFENNCKLVSQLKSAVNDRAQAAIVCYQND